MFLVHGNIVGKHFRAERQMSVVSPPRLGGSLALPVGSLARLVLAAVLCCISSTSFGQLPTPRLNTIDPTGGMQGATVDVTLHGTRLDDAAQLQFSHPGITARPKMIQPHELLEPRPAENQFEIDIASDVEPGIYEVRAIGRFGASNPRAFVVTHLDEVTAGGQNTSAEAAQPVQLGKVATGRVPASTVNYYRITLQQGERMLVECLAQRIDSRMDAVLVCYDQQGRELARVRNAESADPLLDFTAPHQGQFVIAVHDFLYQGGHEYFYRLRFHNQPHIDFAMPPAIEPGQPFEVTLYGRNLPQGKPAPDVVVDGVELQQQTVTITAPDDELGRTSVAVGDYLSPRGALLDAFQYQLEGSNPLRIGFAQAPVILQQLHEAGRPQVVSVPCEIAGQFRSPREVDVYEFEASQGEVLWIEVLSHRLDQYVDPFLHIQRVTVNEDGDETVADLGQADAPPDRNARIGSNFDVSTDDPFYRLVVDQDGVYRVTVRNLFSGDDPGRIYRLIIRPETPDFRLFAFPEQTKLAHNNQVEIHSAIVRRGGTTIINTGLDRREGFDGEVQLSVEGLPDGVRSRGAVMGGHVHSAWLVIEADADARPWAGPIRIVGRTELDGRTVMREARTGTCIWGTDNRQIDPPAFRVTRDLYLSVIEEPSRAFIEAGDGTLLETSLGGTLQVPLNVSRREDFQGDLTLVATGLPNELRPGDVAVSSDASSGTLEIAVTNNQARPGTYTFLLRADSQIRYAPNPDAVARAEQDQQAIAAVLEQVNDEVGKATQRRDEANRMAQEAAEALRLAEQQRDNDGDEQRESAETKVGEAREQLEAAEQQRAQAEQTLAELQAKQTRTNETKAEFDRQLENARSVHGEQDVNVAFYSTPIKLRITPTPLAAQLPDEPQTVQQGATIEVPVTVEKKYGFDDALEIQVELPAGVSGLQIPNQSIPKEENHSRLEIQAAADATVGQHTLTVRIRGRFNNVDVQAEKSLVLRVSH